jgi:BlaI family transcriptional regulator, penicillinase repressor
MSDSNPKIKDMTRRERQIMDVIYRLGKASAVEVMENLPGKPVNATIRTMLGVLENKGFVYHERIKGRFIYYPTISVTRARKNALDNVLSTFFQGSEASAVISILKKSEAKLSPRDLAQIEDLLEQAHKEGR